jgi:hypothetical protein
MEIKYIALALVIVVFLLFLVGGTFTDTCASIGDCRACWSNGAYMVDSDLCTETGRCLADPVAQQNNAIVDVILCACSDAKAIGYTDAALNKRISEFAARYTPYNISAQEICDQPSMFLAKTAYE